MLKFGVISLREYRIGDLVRYKGNAHRIIDIEQKMGGKFYTLYGLPYKLTDWEIRDWCIPI
jgi:hypothetical protein